MTDTITGPVGSQEILMKRLLLVLAVTLAYVGYADACPKKGNRVRGHIRTAVHNVANAPFKIVESKPIRTTFGFTGSGCTNGQCQLKK